MARKKARRAAGDGAGGLGLLKAYRFCGLSRDDLLALEPLAAYDAGHPPGGVLSLLERHTLAQCIPALAKAAAQLRLAGALRPDTAEGRKIQTTLARVANETHGILTTLGRLKRLGRSS